MAVALRLNLDPNAVQAWPERVMDDVLLVLNKQDADSRAKQAKQR